MEATVVQDSRSKKRFLVICIGIAALFAVSICGVMFGSVEFTLAEIYNALFAEANQEAGRIINLLRLPRTIVSALVGANLALAGCILQGVLRNPLADSGIIGVSAGAGLFAMIVMVLMPEQTSYLPIAAFAGALLSTGAVFFLAWERGINPLRMILAGVAIAAFFGGGMSEVSVFFADRIQGTVMGREGGVEGRSGQDGQRV